MAQVRNERHPGADEMEGLDIPKEDKPWVRMAKDAFDYTTDYMDDSIRANWEDAMRRFQNLHPHGSKYHDDVYAKRSRMFRPKTRSAERRTGALAASALFSNEDLVDIRGQNRNSIEQAAAASIHKELLQYRLNHTVPWFTTAMGARQDAFNYGPCISFQTWEYETVESVSYIPEFDEHGDAVTDEEGRQLGTEQVDSEIVIDEPTITLVKNENFRFDPNADWRNPIKDSPALIWMRPMYAGDVMSRMAKKGEEPGPKEWRYYEPAVLASMLTSDDGSETVRQARMGDSREDPQDAANAGPYSVIWVHLNIIKVGGRDMAYYTLGTKYLLTEPVPIEELLPLGRKSFTVGFAVIDTHKTYPVSENQIAAPLQEEINDIANQRMDNVKLALNKRYVIKRNAQVDLKALARNVPGGGVFAGDVDDVRVMDTPDVTGSSYQEQDRLANELDELLGNFSSSSVQSNRSLNETVGGMNLLSQDANSVQELALRCWIETWVEPVLRNFARLESMFETDERILQLAGENSQLFQKYGIDTITDELLDQDLVISVNVGIGSSSPQQRLQRIAQAVSSAAALPELASRLNAEEIGKEIFSSSGYSDGGRFIIGEEEFMEKQQKMAEMQQQPPHQIQVAQINAEAAMQRAQMEGDIRLKVAEMQSGAQRDKAVLEAEIAEAELESKEGLERTRLQTQRDSQALKSSIDMREVGARERSDAMRHGS